MAANLVKAGHTVHGFDPVPAAVEAAEANGIKVFPTAVESVVGAEVVITMLPSGSIVKTLYAEILPAATSGALFIDSSTISVDDARRINAQANDRGFAQVDAPVSGGVEGAKNGKLSIMVGGDADVLARAKPALDAYADRLIARVEAAMAKGAPPPGTRPITALVFQPNGMAAGSGTLVDEMMRRAGFVNVAQRYGLKRWGNVSLERLLDDPPEVLLAGQAAPNAATWAERILVHPALAAVSPRMTRAVFPERLLYCGGPVLIETAAAMALARAQALKEGA